LIKKRLRRKQFDPENPGMAMTLARDAIRKWAARCTLSRAPELPNGFHGRLLSIADDLSEDGVRRHGETARAAAVKLGANRQHENPRTALLTDIRTVFDMSQAARLTTKTELIPALAGLEDSLRSDWTGIDDAGAPHLVTPGDLCRMLRDFGIRSKTLWPPRREEGTKCEAGYYRHQFEKAWDEYCEKTATPPHMNKIRLLGE
jgi:Protein of unknown function (DUF3631)